MCRMNAYLHNCGPQQFLGGIIAVLVVILNGKRVCLSHATVRMKRLSVICVLSRLQDRVRYANTLMHCQSLLFSDLTSSAPHPASIPEYTFFCPVFLFLTICGILLVLLPHSSNISLLLLFSC